MSYFRLRATLAIAATAAAVLSFALPAQNAHRGNGNTSGQPSSSEGRRNGRMIRGSVTGTGTNSVTLKTDDGEVWTVQTTENTRLIKDQQPVKLSTVKPGDEVFAFGVPDAPAREVHALMVGVMDAAMAAKARADMGKTYIFGRITAMDETRLTVVRPDHVTQTINVDETTSFHRGGRMNLEGLGFGTGFAGPEGGGRHRAGAGASTDARVDENGESITLADIKVGDTIGATGSVKAGVFVPTDLRVQGRRSHGEGPGGGGNDALSGPQ